MSDLPVKKRKLNFGCLPSRDTKSTSQPSHWDIVPVEILAEILCFVNSPKDVLSVARCNKRLCATLLNPSNVMIWRRARSSCIVPDLPPPPPGWSEPAYAAFVFDGGNCHICGIWTERMFLSFVVRVRLCGKHKCRKTFFNEQLATQGHAYSKTSKEFFFQQRLRQLDVPPLPGSIPPWPSDHTYYYCLRTDMIKVTAEYEEMLLRGTPQDEYLLLHDADIQLQHRVYEHARLLFMWGQIWSRRYRATKGLNTTLARVLAREEGWSLHDLLNNPTYHSLYRSHIRCLELIPGSVVRSLVAGIDAEILSRMENKERRQKTHAQQVRRADIARHYDRLSERKSYSVVPTLTEFRGLPIVKALQDRDDAGPFAPDSPSSARPGKILKSELKRSPLIGGMIESDLKRWIDTALREFDAILGQPNWKRASTKLLRPSERVDARFICTLCPPKGHTPPESLDFRGACAHECAGRQGKATAKRTWKADQFVPDQKAIDVLSQALTQTELRAENRETEDIVNFLGARFRCESCMESLVVMDFWRLAGHCRRHDKMQVKLYSETDALALMSGHEYAVGSFALYTAHTVEAKNMRQTKTFGCRHCRQGVLKPKKRTHRVKNNGDRVIERLFTFDGLVSHVKEKHRINYPMGEEDFYREPCVIVDGEDIM